MTDDELIKILMFQVALFEQKLEDKLNYYNGYTSAPALSSEAEENDFARQYLNLASNDSTQRNEQQTPRSTPTPTPTPTQTRTGVSMPTSRAEEKESLQERIARLRGASLPGSYLKKH